MAKEALEQQPCEDCISREKAKQFLYERIDRLNDDELYDIFSRIIDDMYNELPFVTSQPKIGRWINIDATHSKCDRCGAVFEIASENGEANYCPNCGAKMKEIEE